MQWQQAKHTMATGQAYNGNRPNISVDGPALLCAVQNVGSQRPYVTFMNRPENVNHVTACLQRFVEDAKEESEEEETVKEEEACGRRDFQPVHRECGFTLW
ncbi:hypothetical protein TNCV_5005521 [Trichonephila clavipes]|nr:hypothetical protein TNCV_5005521 [Trichonephila clavipes]